MLWWLQVRVSSEIAHVLSLPRNQLDSFLGAAGAGLASKTVILQALQQSKSLMVSLHLSAMHTRPPLSVQLRGHSDGTAVLEVALCIAGWPSLSILSQPTQLAPVLITSKSHVTSAPCCTGVQ